MTYNIFQNLWQIFINYVKSCIPKKLESRTEKCPLPINVFQGMLEEFLTLKFPDKVMFEVKKQKYWAELRWLKGNILVTLKWPYKDHPEGVFSDKGITMPEWWGIHKIKLKKVSFLVSTTRAFTIPTFLDEIFKKVYGYSDATVIHGRSVLNSKYS